MSSAILYSPSCNLWMREDEGNVAIGVPSSMLAVLGKPEYIDLPDAGLEISPNVPFGALENSKSAFDLAVPFPCRVVSSSPGVDPAALVSAVDGEVPLLVVHPHSEQWTDGLMDAAGYADFIAP